MDLCFSTLRVEYQRDDALIRDVFLTVMDRINDDETQSVWIHRASPDDISRNIHAQLERKRQGEALPLFGLAFAVKDNIDVAGMPTTAACAEFSYRPQKSATIVERLLRSGAICVGKTNMDQFATGLTGTRSPYGICTSAYGSRYISGGSSSGSAVAVARDLVSFSLGTDSGGSGRIPAGFNNIVGLKPTIGAVSLNGIVPNSRCFDCPSILARSIPDALEIFDIVSGFDESDPFSKHRPHSVAMMRPVDKRFRFATPAFDQCEWYGDENSARSFAEGVARLANLGGDHVEIDYSLFREAGQMMLSGPWVAERKAGIRPFFEKHPDVLLGVVREMFDRADRWSAVDVFEWTYRLMSMRRRAEDVFKNIDVLLVPTAPRPFTVEEVLASPIERNIEVGYYSYFVNLLDLCAISVPNGFLPDGMPTSVTFVGPAWHDRKLADLAQLFAAFTPGHVANV